MQYNVCILDQHYRTSGVKCCGHIVGKEIISDDEMVGKIIAALVARQISQTMQVRRKHR